MEEENDIPLIPISPIELHLIDYALFVYLTLAQWVQGQLPEDDVILLTINTLRQRIAAVEIPEGEEQSFSITEDELAVMLHAVTVFIITIDILIPPSTQKDEVITMYTALRSTLTTVFSEVSTANNNEEQQNKEG